MYRAFPDSLVDEDLLLAHWHHASESASSEVVVPDGCQDLIIRFDPGSEPRCSVSPLAHGMELVSIPAHHTMQGFRLQPGTLIDERGLLDFTARHGVAELLRGEQILRFCHRDPRVLECIECLGSGVSSVAEAASELGISVRTLQRTMKQGSDNAFGVCRVGPRFWLALSRLRRCARALPEFDNLAEAALTFGYADQSHMNREIRRWLGVRPSSLGPHSAVHQRLCEPGYD